MNNLIKAFKHFFIPHKHNDYKPHFFREVSITSITIVIIVLLCISAGTTLYINNTDMKATVLPAVLVDLTNNARISNNEQTLTRNDTLDKAAEMKAADMSRYGYFAHTSPAGVTPWYWFDKAGYTFSYAGENLAIDFIESANLEDAWLKSPTHKANILNAKFTEIGIATIDGVYQGHSTTYVVQMFGKPAKASNNFGKTLESSIPNPKISTPTKPEIKSEPKLSTTVAILPSVKGASATSNQNLETVADTPQLIIVKNNTNSVEPDITSTGRSTHYSSWYQRFLFQMPSYTDRIYHILIWILTIALLTMTVVEMRRQHRKNFIYGVLLLVILICLIYINRTIFVSSFLS